MTHTAVRGRHSGMRWLMAGAAVLLVGALLVAGYQASAATDRYTFLIRGIVVGIDHSNKNITVVGTHVASATAGTSAKNDLAGSEQVYKVTGTTFYKWVDGVKKRMTFTKAIASNEVGKEVVIRGAAKSNGSYNASWVVVNDRTFDIRGKLKEYDNTKQTMRILVGTSTYKQSSYAGKEVVLHFSNPTQFKSQGSDIESDSISADSQQVRVIGEIKENQWDVTKFFDYVK